MNTTLTLNIDRDVIESAETYAKSAEKSVSQLVEDYLALVSSKSKVTDGQPLGPITRQLAGIIKLDEKTDRKELLADALMEKYI